METLESLYLLMIMTLKALDLERDDDGNIYDPLAKDLDNDGVPDRYDNDFRDSDYFETTYDVEDNLNARVESKRKGI